MDGTEDETLSEASNIRTPLYLLEPDPVKEAESRGKTKTTTSSGQPTNFD
jgi:hypothetical protein